MAEKKLHEFTVRVAEDFKQERGFIASYSAQAETIEKAVAQAREWFKSGVIVSVQARRENPES